MSEESMSEDEAIEELRLAAVALVEIKKVAARAYDVFGLALAAQEAADNGVATAHKRFNDAKASFLDAVAAKHNLL
jgi:hypothetical protein